jgi:hypothetical protein
MLSPSLLCNNLSKYGCTYSGRLEVMLVVSVGPPAPPPPHDIILSPEIVVQNEHYLLSNYCLFL